ncbi:MAG: ankyrin repeat domain-containing protein [Deltaproteobacteria bacterium]|nr:ankyrin repeat domain-containing protein [Deltaproteobacteria bacterium]
MDHPYPPEQQLLDATAFSDLAWMTKLLSRGTSTEARDEDHRTPLHLAVDGADCDAVRLLLDAGADVNARDQSGCTPLHHAARQRHLSLAYLLVTYGADVNARDFAGSSVLWQAVIVSLPSSTVVEFLRRHGASDEERDNEAFDAKALAQRLGLTLEPVAEPALFARGH